MYTHSSFQGPVRTGTFEKLANRVYIPAGDAIHVYGSSLFLFFAVALKFLRLLRFSPLLKNAANQNFSSIHL